MINTFKKPIINLITVVVISFCFLVNMICVTQAQTSVSQKRSEEDIKIQLESELKNSIPFLEETDRDNVTIINTDLGYSYNEKEGLMKIDVYKVDKNGMVTLKTGQKIPVLQEKELDLSYDSGILATYEPYRRVKSNNGYRKCEGYINLPSSSNLRGVDSSGEAAYNYFGIENTYGVNDECGLFYASGTYNNKWWVYHNFNGNWVWDMKPTGGISPGTRVFMRLYVPQDNQLAFRYEYSGGSETILYTSGCGSTKYNGANQKLRRLTTLLVNNTNSYSRDNIWQNIYIATPSNMHLWGTSDTSGVTTTNYVSVTETNRYYNETVNINIP
ncbi:MAG TPA: hypothetical protein DCK87_07150 [Desulfotomaculum sp.]|nr:hypothetical protein [Desulfotomaculum sp.]